MDHSKSLKGIRNKIDKIDLQIHDLLIKRSEMVNEIISAKKQENSTDTTIYRPAREAEVLTRLVKHHKGNLPHNIIINIWRILLSAFCAMQGDFSVNYFTDLNEDEALRALIYYYFGSTIEIQKASTEQNALKLVQDKKTTISILPINSLDISNEWWLNIPKDLYISSTLPFIIDDKTVKVRNNYMIVSKSIPIKTDHDKSLFKLSSNPNIGRMSIINCFDKLKYKSKSLSFFDAKDLSQRFHLIEVDGFFESHVIDEFCQKIISISSKKIINIEYLGSYPAPISLADYTE